MNEEEWKKEAPMPSRYEPPGVRLLLELLNILAANGKVKLTVTLESGQDGEAS